jgi:threonine dehydrogenase-like Zn-dependent dehydrogenase
MIWVAGEMSTTARAFWVTGPSRGEIREEVLPAPGEHEILVETLYTAVSRGTEALVFRGCVPESEYERMGCPHQGGSFPAPVKYGYSNVGRVTSGSAALEGRLVFCLYPHQTAYVVKETDVVLVPDHVPAARAVLTANLETALNAVWDAQPRLGDHISVVGAGVVGCLVAHLARGIAGTDVELIDVLPERAEVAAALGIRFVLPERASPERDLVFHASGHPSGLITALELAAPDSSVIELSWFGDQPVTLPLGQAFHVRRLSLRASQVGSISPNARRRFSYRSRLELALSLLSDPRLDLLFSDESRFDTLPDTMQRLTAAPGPLCHRVRYV